MVRSKTLGTYGLADVALFALLIAAGAGCSDPDSTTNLRPEGPPEVLQVFVLEPVDDPNYALCPRANWPSCPQLAYGDHPGVPMLYDDRSVMRANPGIAQRIRVVMDELLQGNHLEEIACADGTFSRVPVGATPDDIAACSGPLDAIRTTCQGDHAVCINPDTGTAVGILDSNGDGAVDAVRFIQGAVRLVCDGVDIPLDPSSSFYQPSGNQLIPASNVGINGLGPALVLVPDDGLRTSSSCSIEFDSSVVDKDGNGVCAPARGQACVAGDTGAIVFGSDELKVVSTAPADGNTSVNPAGAAQILIRFNAKISAGNPGTITITAGGTPIDTINVTASQTDLSVVLPGGYQPATEYVVTVSGTQDFFGGVLPAEHTFTFATRVGLPDAAVPDAPVVDAEVPDAEVPDAEVPDAEAPDAAVPDAAIPDAAAPDA
jgi:hypothetical protein